MDHEWYPCHISVAHIAPEPILTQLGANGSEQFQPRRLCLAPCRYICFREHFGSDEGLARLDQMDRLTG